MFNTKVIIAILGTFMLIGAGCSSDKLLTEKDFQESPPAIKTQPSVAASLVISPSSTLNNTPSQVVDRTPAQEPSSALPLNTTPRERGMVRVYVRSAKTKFPIPGIVIVVSHSSDYKTTNREGWAEFSMTAGNLYVPKMTGFNPSEVVNSAEGDEKGIINILLSAESE